MVEIRRIVEARTASLQERAAAEIDRATYVAWRTAQLMRAKEFPTLQSLLTVKAPEPAQTPDQMIAVAKMITAALGGTIISKARH